jgi:hypothetical protein
LHRLINQLDIRQKEAEIHEQDALPGPTQSQKTA